MRFTMWAAAIALVAGTFLYTSCEKSPTAEAGMSEISFDVTNQMLADNGFGKKDASNGVPECTDGEPASVVVDVDGTVYTLDLLSVNDGNETTVIELESGVHIINSFVVYDEDGVVLWAAPMSGSEYADLWGLDGVTKEFIVGDFEKIKVPIDVLCYKVASWEAFGFAWFEYSAYEQKEVCFFGDICTKFWPEFNADGSVYQGWISDENYDFQALYDIVMVDENGEALAFADESPMVFSNYPAQYDENQNPVYGPVCATYLDNLQAPDEVYNYQIWVYLPDGTKYLAFEGTFTDGDWSEAGVNPWGGPRGIQKFVVGDCYDESIEDVIMIEPILELPGK